MFLFILGQTSSLILRSCTAGLTNSPWLTSVIFWKSERVREEPRRVWALFSQQPRRSDWRTA